LPPLCDRHDIHHFGKGLADLSHATRLSFPRLEQLEITMAVEKKNDGKNFQLLIILITVDGDDLPSRLHSEWSPFRHNIISGVGKYPGYYLKEGLLPVQWLIGVVSCDGGFSDSFG